MCTINFALMLSSKDEVSYWFIYVNMMNIIKSEPYYCELDVLCHFSPGNLSHFRANLETNCNSFYFPTVLFYEVPRMTY